MHHGDKKELSMSHSENDSDAYRKVSGVNRFIHVLSPVICDATVSEAIDYNFAHSRLRPMRIQTESGASFANQSVDCNVKEDVAIVSGPCFISQNCNASNELVNEVISNNFQTMDDDILHDTDERFV